ncbi:hypothetical protein [Desulfobacula sp.]|uniref:hypothetical protein n=1 Tax=Desulfobacula sp. TaxID=2593537 RepID=UPI002638D8C3|nr:hypothetical protein [Desulfobacula sp.]
MIHTDINKEIKARIFLQTQHLSPILNLSTEKNSKLSAATIDVTLKLQAMVYHIGNYGNLDKYYQNDAINSFHEYPITFNNCCSLIYEFEAFFFQLKSALDLAIKVIGILLPNHFKTKTFGKNGENFIKNLENFKTIQTDRVQLIDSIIKIIKSDQNVWLKDSIEMRNTISHYKSMRSFVYKVKKEKGQLIVEKPKVLNLDPLCFMENTFINCMEFIQDLISFSIILYLSPAFILTKPNVPNSWHDDGVGKYIKYSLGIDEKKMKIVEADH